MRNFSGILMILFIGAGLIGSYRAIVKKNDLLTKWHACLFLGVPLMSYIIYEKKIKIDDTIAIPSILVFYILWMTSGIEVYNATQEKPKKTTPKEYFYFVAKILLMAVVFKVFMELIK